MSGEDDDDLYDEEFDFVDDDDEDKDEADSDDDAEMTDEARNDDRREDEAGGEEDLERQEGDEPVDEYGRPEPKADYVVHVYEHKKFKRTIDRPFTPEDAEAFATEFNRTSKNYGRMAVSGKVDAKPKKALD